MKESEIQKQCIDYLSIKKIFNFKINNGGICKPNGAYIPAQTRGLPDLVMHYRKEGYGGEVIYLEIKTEKGKLSEYQIAFQEQCQRDGISYYLIRSLDDLMKIL